MFCMTVKNIIDMDAGRKVETLRPVKPSGKGYFKPGTEQLIKLNMFSRTWFLKVNLTGRELVNLDDMTRKDFLKVGYNSHAAYMREPFNKNNPAADRVKYSFEVIERAPEMEILKAAYYNYHAAKAARNIYFQFRHKPRPASSPYDAEILAAENQIKKLKRM